MVATSSACNVMLEPNIFTSRQIIISEEISNQHGVANGTWSLKDWTSM